MQGLESGDGSDKTNLLHKNAREEIPAMSTRAAAQLVRARVPANPTLLVVLFDIV